MRAVRVEQPGGADVLAVRDVPEPEPGPGQLLVRVAAAGVNFIDVYQRSGAYPVPTPFTLGLEGAGTVVAVGAAGVAEVREGDRVAWAMVPGSAAELALVPAERAVPVPEGVEDETAAAVMLQGMTAQYLCTTTYPVGPGDPVLVHAAAGGVGLLLTQLATRRGGRVIATVSTAEKDRLARSAGAQEVIRYTEQDFAARSRELTGGVGVAAAYDAVGRTTWEQSLAALRPRGILVLYGAASGPVPPVDPQRLNSGGSLFLTRPSLAHYTATREELLERAGEVLAAVAGKDLDVRIGGRYPLEQARAAYEDLEGRRTTGKLLLVP